MRVRKAVIPAAGFGTRFLPATKAQPKEMLPLVDTPIIHFVVQEALQAGIEDFLIVTGRGKRAIEDHFDRSMELEMFLERRHKTYLSRVIRELGSMADIHFVRQKEPLGLGHAISLAEQHVGDEPFAVLLGDEIFVGQEPCLAQLVRVHERLGGTILGVHAVPYSEVHRYGVIQPEQIQEGLYRAVDMVEKPPMNEAPSNLAIVGRYILDASIFPILKSLQPGMNNEIQLTDGLRILNQSAPVYASIPNAKRYDVGDKLGFVQATVELALARADIGPEFSAYLKELVIELPEAADSLARAGGEAVWPLQQ